MSKKKSDPATTPASETATVSSPEKTSKKVTKKPTTKGATKKVDKKSTKPAKPAKAKPAKSVKSVKTAPKKVTKKVTKKAAPTKKVAKEKLSIGRPTQSKAGCYTAAELAAVEGVHILTIYRWIRTGLITAERDPKTLCWYIPKKTYSRPNTKPGPVARI
jgi:hypothetical protein